MNRRFWRILLTRIAALAVLAALVRIAILCLIDETRRVAAQNDAVSGALGATAFHEEYGRFPGTNSGILGGNILAALTGENKEINPKGLEFIEAPNAKKGKGGITNGTLVDPWGAPFFIAFDTDNDGRVVAGTNSINVALEGNAKAAVWNDPNLGLDAAKKSAWTKRTRYVTSWEYLSNHQTHSNNTASP